MSSGNVVCLRRVQAAPVGRSLRINRLGQRRIQFPERVVRQVCQVDNGVKSTDVVDTDVTQVTSDCWRVGARLQVAILEQTAVEAYTL